MSQKISEKMLNTFVEVLPRLETVEVIGVARLLKVKLYKEDKEPRSSQEILEECIVNFSKLNRERRKELLEVMKACANKKDKKNKKESTPVVKE